MATRVGTHLDRYEIEAELGRGAMGVVYRARDPKLGRTVAIKTVSISGLELDAEREYRARFVIEAQAAGRLSHPGIVTIFDVREEAEPYLVMEYIEGQSLQKLLGRENRTLPLTTTLGLIQEIADALHYAHAQGVEADSPPAGGSGDAGPARGGRGGEAVRILSTSSPPFQGRGVGVGCGRSGSMPLRTLARRHRAGSRATHPLIPSLEREGKE